MGEDETRFHIVTGGPGSGKSTLIEALMRRGYAAMPEAGRAIIRDQVKIGGPALPWADRALFAELMLGWELRSHHMARSVPGPVLFDRGVPDVAGYLTLCGLPVPAHVEEAARRWRYHARVFVAPHWPEIFGQDEERKQSPQEAEATLHAVAQAYESFGYRLILLPRTGVEERADFVEAQIAEAK